MTKMWKNSYRASPLYEARMAQLEVDKLRDKLARVEAVAKKWEGSTASLMVSDLQAALEDEP